MQLRRSTEILNSKGSNNTIIYCNSDFVIIISVDSNIGIAYVKSSDNKRFEVNLEELAENK